LGLGIGIAVSILIALVFWPRGGLFNWVRRSRNHSSRIFAEDGLKHLYKEELNHRQATLQSLGGALQVSLNRAAEVVEDLRERDLLGEVGDGIRLNEEGRRYALSIIRAHRLWEQHLAEETGVAQSEWHQQAELQEHHLSPQETNDLAARLGHPTHDPHGDPIPTADGDMRPRPGQSTATVEVGVSARIVHIEDEPDEVYAQIVAMGFYPGMIVRVIENGVQRVRLWAGGEERVLAPVVAANLSVVPLVEEEPSGETDVGTTLTAVDCGKEVEVARILPLCRWAERRRLMDLGVLPGTTVFVEMESAGGNLKAYRIRDALIALRKEQTDVIEVQIKVPSDTVVKVGA